MNTDEVKRKCEILHRGAKYLLHDSDLLDKIAREIKDELGDDMPIETFTSLIDSAAALKSAAVICEDERLAIEIILDKKVKP